MYDFITARIYRIIGKEKTLDLFYKTQDIEEAGGLLIQVNCFIQCIKYE